MVDWLTWLLGAGIVLNAVAALIGNKQLKEAKDEKIKSLESHLENERKSFESERKALEARNNLFSKAVLEDWKAHKEELERIAAKRQTKLGEALRQIEELENGLADLRNTVSQISAKEQRLKDEIEAEIEALKERADVLKLQIDPWLKSGGGRESDTYMPLLDELLEKNRATIRLMQILFSVQDETEEMQLSESGGTAELPESTEEKDLP